MQREEENRSEGNYAKLSLEISLTNLCGFVCSICRREIERKERERSKEESVCEGMENIHGNIP